MVSVTLTLTLCNVSIILSKWILDVHLRSDSTELADAVPIGIGDQQMTLASKVLKLSRVKVQTF